MTNIIDIAEAYYLAMAEKNTVEMGKYLHPNVHFVGPSAEMTGRGEVLDATAKLLPFFRTLTIREKIAAGHQVMIAYDIENLPPINSFRITAILTIEDNQITKIVLFYNARPFDVNKTNLFGQ